MLQPGYLSSHRNKRPKPPVYTRAMVLVGGVVIVAALGYMALNLGQAGSAVAVCIPFVIAGGAMVVGGLLLGLWAAGKKRK